MAPLIVMATGGRKRKERYWAWPIAGVLLAITAAGVGMALTSDVHANAPLEAMAGHVVPRRSQPAGAHHFPEASDGPSHGYHSVASGAMTANGSRGSVTPFVGAHYSDTVRYGGSVAAFTWGGGARPPVAGFTATPLGGVAPLTVTFTNTTTGRVTGYQWDFGDHTTSVITHPVHVYTTSGVYTVSLTASGPGGSDTLTRTNYVTVTGSAEYIARVITYTYDPLSRLTGALYSSGEQFEYAYDGVGNRTTYTVTLGSTTVTTYTYDAANRLTAAGDVAYTWDARGNLVNDGTFTYTYNAAGRLVGAQSLTATLVYTYNGDGLRVSRSANGTASTYAWDVADPLPQMLSEGASLYVPDVGWWDGAAWAYALSDGLGSVRQLADAGGRVVQRYDYTPFGETLAAQGTWGSALRYTGEYWDGDAGLVYLRARWYEPALGRFVSADTIVPEPGNPQSLNRYSYVLGNPLGYADPSGHDPASPVNICSYAPVPGCGSGAVWYYPLPISFEGSWTLEDEQVIGADTWTIATRMATLVGADQILAQNVVSHVGRDPTQYSSMSHLWGLSPGKTFEAVFVQETFSLNAAGGLGCDASVAGVIACGADTGGCLSEYGQTGLPIHELGHHFDARAGRLGSDWLEDNEIVDATAAHVAGRNPATGNLERTDLGYRSATFPDQQHPRWMAGGDPAHEDYADMFMNWVQNSFDYSPAANGAGTARYNWMTTNMAEWIAAATR